MTNTKSERIYPPEVQENGVIENCHFLHDIQVWPAYGNGRITPTEWLANFTNEEKRYAVQMLAAFHYFPEPMVEQMLRQAILNVFTSFLGNPKTLVEGIQSSQDLMKQTIVTRVTGEIPSDTDSGFRFVRRARQYLGFDTANIVPPEEALRQADSGCCRLVLFLDDLVGSGDQCIQTWIRRYSAASNLSFREVAQSSPAKFIYCPLVATEYGFNRVTANCQGLHLNPLHYLPSNYSLLSQDSIFWPAEMRQEGQRVIYEASRRAGLLDHGRTDLPDWRGYHNLGLALAIGDCVPDASLPIFYWDQNWSPLVRRT